MGVLLWGVSQLLQNRKQLWVFSLSLQVFTVASTNGRKVKPLHVCKD
uniref:Uncharacterized protein n=1 Tax=Nelumbo nucifera TaxID=4432 RepID=A0A822XGI3_NELNU|nr:TPA_asm: hypothetical protein HUJ06_020800 [Nelumbo nucifera]